MARRSLLIVAFVLLVGVAPRASACEDCFQYFNYESLTWCWYCDVSPCGYFQCSIRYYSGLGSDYCGGDDAGCFEYRRHCRQEPDPLAAVTQPLAQKWRLVGVQVHDASSSSVVRTSSHV
ncbi:MAG TPA: hypothetical protein VEK57_17905 [Thermoanaerobaculia bacterium]|nr:hypothetical protein [Thermoanaerobaculia bacterium]